MTFGWLEPDDGKDRRRRKENDHDGLDGDDGEDVEDGDDWEEEDDELVEEDRDYEDDAGVHYSQTAYRGECGRGL